MTNLRELPKLRDGLSYLYIERGRIEQRQRSIAWYSPDGEVSVPCAALAVLLLGPGTSITHAAVKALAENGCSICWIGEDGIRFYASGIGETHSSRNLLSQAAAWADETAHMRTVERMYRMRFDEPLPERMTLRQIRGLEGVRVRDAYARASRETGVTWSGRNYRRGSWQNADPINRALSAGFACIYGICHAAIVSLGYSPALGFIHTGKQLSFVYDIADLYKTQLVVPTAFAVTAESDRRVEGRVREKLRDEFRTARLLERIVDDLSSLFDALVDENLNDEDMWRPGDLWDPDRSLAGGVNYGGDGPGESPDELAR